MFASFYVWGRLLRKRREKGMFEEMTLSATHWLIIIFGLVLFFIIVYGALGVRASKTRQNALK